MIKQIFCSLVLLLSASVVFAMPVNGLYDARVNVADQSKEAYNQAVITGAQQVLVKLTGDRDVILDANVSQQLTTASQWVTSFSYEQVSSSTAEVTTNTWVLNFHFNEQAINHLLSQTQHALWERDRPQVLLWLAQQTSEGQQLIGNGSESAMVQLISQVGNNRGLSLMLPMLDLDDLHQVSVEDVWAPLPALATLMKASKRYNTDSLLIGRLYPGNGNNDPWQGDWLLVMSGEQESWHNAAATQEDVVATGVNHFIDNVAQQHRINAGANQERLLQVQVFGVANISDLSKVKGYLQGLSLVDNLKVATLGENYVTFSLQVKGDTTQLVTTLAEDHLLTPQTGDASLSGQLTYKLAA